MRLLRTTRRSPGSDDSSRSGDAGSRDARRSIALAAGLAAALLAFGCQSDGQQVDGNEAAANANRSQNSTRDGGVNFVVDPADARDFGYRIDWQYPSTGIPLKMVADTGGAIFTLDELNYLSRHDRDSGDRRWRVPVGDSVDTVQGIHYLPEMNQIFVLAGGAKFVLDAENGSIVDRRNLPKIAATDGVIHRDDIIYGARNGQLVWRSLRFDSDRQAYQVANAIRVPPVMERGVIVVLGVDGTVMAIDARRASRLWERRLLDRAVAKPAVGNDVVYVAGTDQHLRAFALREDRTPLWAYLSESRLTASPTLIDDRVYQQIPSEGLVAFEALPLDSPGGVVIWRSEDADGSVITKVGSKLIAWNDDADEIEVIDARLGGVLQTIALKNIAGLKTSGVVDAELLMWSEDGRIVMLTPRMAN